MKFFTFIVLISVASLLEACAKKDHKEEYSLIPSDDPKSFLTNAGSDSINDYYISALLDGKQINLVTTLAESFPSNDTLLNALYTFPDSSDNIHIIRRNADNTVQLELYFSNARLHRRQFPYEPTGFPSESPELGMAQLSVINLSRIGRVAQNSPNDDYSFNGYTSLTCKVQVLSFVDYVVEGTFEGPVKTNTGAVIHVANGRFRIKLVPVSANIPRK